MSQDGPSKKFLLVPPTEILPFLEGAPSPLPPESMLWNARYALQHLPWVAEGYPPCPAVHDMLWRGLNTINDRHGLWQCLPCMGSKPPQSMLCIFGPGGWLVGAVGVTIIGLPHPNSNIIMDCFTKKLSIIINSRKVKTYFTHSKNLWRV